MAHLLLLGSGYSAAYIAERFLKAGFRVSATTRDCTHQEQAKKPMPSAVTLIETNYHDFTLPADCTHLIMTAPVSLEEDDILWSQITKAVHQAVQLQWIGYLSTTSVYGDAEGAWVVETASLNPSSPRAHKRALAEEKWTALAREKAIALDIFRLTGIYGPGRSAIDSLRAGRARMIIKENQVFNRIHVADIAAVCFAAVDHSTNQAECRVFNVSDGQPAPPQDVITFAAEMMGVPCPPAIPFAQADLSPMAHSFYSENKRIDNGKMLAELAVDLNYPTYQDGLRAIWAGMSQESVK